MDLPTFITTYDQPGAVVLLEGNRDVRPADGPKLTALATLLAQRTKYMRFRSGNAGGADAFFAAGVTFGGYDGLVTALSDPIALGIVCGLVIGKVVGIFGTTRLLAAATRASLDSSLRWIDVFGVSLLAGIGFTVSLLIGDLAFGTGSARQDIVKVGVLAGSLLAAFLAAILLRIRNRHYRRVFELETADTDHDGVPDVYVTERDGHGSAA